MNQKVVNIIFALGIIVLLVLNFTKKRESVLLPPLYANGFLVLSEEVIFHYKWAYEGNYPDVEDQFSLNWMDPKLNITWPINNPILSSRDANSSFL